VLEGQILLEIYDTAALQVRVTLPSSAVDSVKQAMARGEAITARLEDGSFRSIELEQLAAEVTTGRSGVDGLFRVGVDESLEIGKAVDVTVVMPALQQVTVIPVQSLYGDDRIYTVVAGRLRGVEVNTLGRRIGSNGEVQLLVKPTTDALEGEVLTTSLPQAGTGLKVNVVNG
jgi:hypothetical protein